MTPTDLDHYIAIFDATPEQAEDAADFLPDIRAAADPIAAVHEAAVWGYDDGEKIADLWCRMHGRPLTEAWRLAARAHGGYADKDQAEALRALVGMVPVPGSLVIETQQESDGRWIAEIPAMPGCLVYGTTRWEAVKRVVELAAEVGEP